MVNDILTVAEFRERVPSGRTDAQLQDMMDASAEIVNSYPNAMANNGVYITPAGYDWGRWPIIIGRPIASVVSITQRSMYYAGKGVVLDAADYRLDHDGSRILYTGRERLPAGYLWYEVEYKPVDVIARRKLAVVMLTRLTSQFTGNQSEYIVGSIQIYHNQLRKEIAQILKMFDVGVSPIA